VSNEHIDVMTDPAKTAPTKGAARAALRAKPCPICGKPAAEATLPFCSRRCADVDLNRWLSGVYAVPVVEAEDEDGMPATMEPDEKAS
jgi:endogenous inhibitor of DNA gyrase (YacG/DUF329 family)